jgi:uncharacterized protein YcbK (DUF882 family)
LKKRKNSITEKKKKRRKRTVKNRRNTTPEKNEDNPDQEMKYHCKKMKEINRMERNSKPCFLSAP